MAGFTNRRGPLTNSNPVTKLLKDLSNLGMAYDDMVIRNSRAVGFTENKMGYTMNPMGSDSDDMYAAFAALSLTDTSLKKNISLFDTNYIKKRDELRAYAIQDEIEEILDVITDEAIVYDETNFMAYTKFSGFIPAKIEEEIGDVYNDIYNYFGFNDSTTAWNYFRKWLIDGYIAFEIVYNDDQTEIIGFKELDPVSLMPSFDTKENKKVWVQYKGEGVKERVLYDSQIIYISYSQINSPQRISYVERLIRSFNLLRIMEHSRIIWAVSNASFKTLFTIPVGGKSKTRAKQSLAALMNSYREVVDFNFDSGEIKTNGKPMMPFNKEYWFPTKDGETPEMTTLGGDGPDLGDTESLKYFDDKLKIASKIPFSRFDRDGGGGSYEMDASGMMRDEIKFSKFISRLRSIFQEILVKPVYIQMCLNHPELNNDVAFKSGLGLQFVKDNVFEELKEMELQTKRVDFIGNMKTQLSTMDAEMTEIPYFDLGFLIKRYGGFTRDDIAANKRAKQRTSLEEEGYLEDDIEKILKGANKDEFEPDKPETDELEDPLGDL